MATSYLSLATSLSSNTFFSDYLSVQDLNLEKIDTFASSVASVAAGAYGIAGSVTLLSSGWMASMYTITLSELGAADAVTFEPLSRDDKTAFTAAQPIVSADPGGQIVTFDVLDTPVVDIVLKYFIQRGRANG